MAPRAEEGRGKLRKAAGSCKQATTHRYPNGETHLSKPQVSYFEKIEIAKGTRRTETSKYPEEKKVTTISKVAASEMEEARQGARMKIVE